MVENDYIKSALKKLRKSCLKITKQRMSMINVIFGQGNFHFTIEQIYKEINKKKLKISLATIYNCINQFRDIGLVKAVKISSSKVYFDTNLKDHHHFFCVKSGKLTDVKTNQVKISRLPKLPKGKSLESVEIIININ